MSSTVDDGWGDDEDIDISGENFDGDGWKDDGEDLDIQDDDLEGDGWGDDDDFFDDDDIDNVVTSELIPPTNQPVDSYKSSLTVNGANFIDDGKSSHCNDTTETSLHECRNISPPPPRHIPAPLKVNHQNSQMVSELSNYISSLSRMLSSINAVLEFEYNTYEKAEELVEYYSARPQLAEYTRSKELMRMDYEVVLPYGHIETNKDRILVDNLLPDDAIVSRASNQSLLADLLQVITGHDLIVRPQYFTICIATWCKFTIHRGDDGADMVDCRANLSLSLPTEQGDRLVIAEVAVSVIFSPGQPMVEFKVQKIDVLLEETSKLSAVAEFLSAIEGGNDDLEIMNASPDIFRDAFLERSQRLLSLSSEGMKSALQQVDSVVNLTGKIQRISSFIPATDQLLEAEQEAMAFAEARREQHQQQQQHTMASFPRPPPPPPPRIPDTSYTQPMNSNERPKSILGGLVSSGWKTLAKTVALPDDVDPAIYGEDTQAPPPRVSLYNKPDEPTRLYRKEDIARSDARAVPNKIDAPRVSLPYNQIHSSNEPENPPMVNQGFHQRSEKVDNSGLSDAQLKLEKPKNFPQIDCCSEENRTAKTDDQYCETLHGIGEEVGVADENLEENGWDDDFGFDDDELEETDDPLLDAAEDEKEGERSIDTQGFAVVDSSSAIQAEALSNGNGFHLRNGVPTSRKRWMNPRPFRPYLTG